MTDDIITLRDKLMIAALKYIREGKDGTTPERIRTASHLSGIPIRTLEAEMEKI